VEVDLPSTWSRKETGGFTFREKGQKKKKNKKDRPLRTMVQVMLKEASATQRTCKLGRSGIKTTILLPGEGGKQPNRRAIKTGRVRSSDPRTERKIRLTKEKTEKLLPREITGRSTRKALGYIAAT